MFKKLASAVVETIHDAKEGEKEAQTSTSSTGAGKTSSNKVTVCVRVRPRNQKELDAEMPVFFGPTDDGLNIREMTEDGDVTKNWSYDYCYGPDNDNKYIFHSVGTDLVDAALDGYNSVMFMYGQTSSGKTFTLFGAGPEHPGLVDYSLEYLNSKVMAAKEQEYLIKMTYSELYNEEIKDLLSATPTGNLKIIDDPNLGPYVQNITEHLYKSAEEAKKVLAEGEERRHFGVTNMNAHSSRSHVLVRLQIESRKVNFEPTNPLRTSWGRDKPNSLATLNLVDLAGSERANKSGTSGQALKEGSFINKSLLTLGTVIFNLSEGKLGSHIPYRNSKLTRLLSTALGGNARTTMITCISPASGNVLESLSTLRFASRAKRIVNQVKKNEVLDTKTLHSRLSMQNDLIEQLKAKLASGGGLGDGDGEGGGPAVDFKQSAVRAAKDVRSIKALLSSTPRVVTSLRNAGKKEEASRVTEDLKLGLAGKKDLHDVLTAQAELLALHVPEERALMDKLAYIGQQNEAEEIYGLPEDGAGSGAGDKTGSSLQSISEDSQDGDGGLGGEEDHLHDLVEGMLLGSGGGGGANSEEVECAAMSREDLLSACVPKLAEQARALQDERTVMGVLKGKFEEAVRKEEAASKEVATAKARQKQGEEDVKNLRVTMKTEMEKLRANMYTLLQDKGETAQVMADRQRQAESQTDAMKDELEAAVGSTKRLGIEVAAANNRVAALVKAEKSASRDAQKLRMELADAKQESDKLRLNIVNGSAKVSVLEANIKRLTEQMSENQRKADRKEDTLVKNAKNTQEVLQNNRAATEKRLQSVQHEKDMALEEHKSEKRTLELRLTQLGEDLDLAESRYDDLHASEKRVISRYERAEQTLRDTIAGLTAEKEDLQLRNEQLEARQTEYEHVVARELELAAEAKQQQDDELEGEGDGGEEVWYHDDDSHRDLAKLQASPRKLAEIDRQRVYLQSEAPEMPALGREGDDRWDGLKVATTDFLRLRYGMKLVNAALRYTLVDSASLHTHTGAALRGEQEALSTSSRERSVLEDNVNKLSAACDLYENEFGSAKRNKQASHAYISDLEQQLAYMRGDHARALYAESQALAEQQRLQDGLNRLEITSKRQENAMNALRDDSSRGQAMLDSTKGEALELKRRLIMAESTLDEREQRLEVLQIERDELARHYYKFERDEDDPFSYTTAESEETGATSSNNEATDTDDGAKGRGSKHRTRHHRRHHE